MITHEITFNKTLQIFKVINNLRLFELQLAVIQFPVQVNFLLVVSRFFCFPPELQVFPPSTCQTSFCLLKYLQNIDLHLHLGP